MRQLSAAAGELTPKVGALEGRVVALEPRLAELQRSTASLAVAVARARLLLDVVLEAKRTLAFAWAFVPRR